MNTLTIANKSEVIARNGLRLRSGPGIIFDVMTLLPAHTQLYVLKNIDGWSLVDLQGDGNADGFVNTAYLSHANGFSQTSTGGSVDELIKQGSQAEGLSQARIKAKSALPGYPTNGCAAHLSALLQQAGFPVPMIFGAGKLAHFLAEQGWKKIPVGAQQPGDIGVCYDNDPSPPGSDHVYLVIEVIDGDKMMIADNQRNEDVTHERYARGNGKTPTEYFLRA